MRTVHFTWEFPPIVQGGLGTSASELTRQLVRKGHEVTVMALNKDNKLTTSDNWQGVEVHRPKLVDMSDMLPAFGHHGLDRPQKVLKFYSDIFTYNTLSTTKLLNSIMRGDRRKFDLVHSHNWMGVMSGMSTKKTSGMPFIFQVHSTEKGRANGAGSRSIEELEYLGAKKANLVVTVSNAMKKEIITLGMAPPEKVFVCHNGVDTDRFNPVCLDKEKMDGLRKYYNIESGDRVLLYLGRFTGYKGPLDLIEAMPEILKKHPDTKLIMLGEGELKDEIRDRIRKLDLSSNIKVRPEYVQNGERAAHYAIADLCVFPSSYEPFGIACLEAMALGKPVVAGAGGTNGMKEQVIPDGPNKTGIHINGTQPKDIAWGVCEALSSDDELRRMGKNARERAIKDFRWEDKAEEMVKIYNMCLENGF